MGRLYADQDHPRGVWLPEGTGNPPGPEVEPEMKAFWGKTGRWWGTWGSPQSPGGYDAILSVHQITDDREVRLSYGSADYPPWYVTEGVWEMTGTFTRKADGRLFLTARHPVGSILEFWFEANRLQGKMAMRFMLSRIVLKPLVRK